MGDLERNSAFNNNFNEAMNLEKLDELFEEVVNDEDTWIRINGSSPGPTKTIQVSIP